MGTFPIGDIPQPQSQASGTFLGLRARLQIEVCPLSSVEVCPLSYVWVSVNDRRNRGIISPGCAPYHLATPRLFKTWGSKKNVPLLPFFASLFFASLSYVWYRSAIDVTGLFRGQALNCVYILLTLFHNRFNIYLKE